MSLILDERWFYYHSHLNLGTWEWDPKGLNGILWTVVLALMCHTAHSDRASASNCIVSVPAQAAVLNLVTCMWIKHFVQGCTLCQGELGRITSVVFARVCIYPRSWWNTYAEYFSTVCDLTSQKWMMVYWNDLTREGSVLSHLQHIRGTFSLLTSSQCIWQASIKAEILCRSPHSLFQIKCISRCLSPSLSICVCLSYHVMEQTIARHSGTRERLARVFVLLVSEGGI